MTSFLFPLWEEQRLSSLSRRFWLFVRPVSPRSCTAIGTRCRKGCWEKNSNFSGVSWFGDSNEVGRVTDAPVNLCSQDIRPSFFFISNAWCECISLFNYVSLDCVHVPFYCSFPQSSSLSLPRPPHSRALTSSFISLFHHSFSHHQSCSF